MAELKFAIVTCSDTRSIEQDTAGAALEALIAENGWECASRVIVKDERADIAAAIVQACDEIDADIVLTCGGSGLSLRDVTPEATQDVCERNVPGIAEAMRAHVKSVYARHGGNMAQARKALGISLNTLKKYLRSKA